MKIPAYLAVAAAAVLTVAACVSTPPAQLESREFTITVDDGASVEDLLGSGGYGWSWSEVNSKNFPATAAGTRTLTVRLVAFGNLPDVDRFVGAEKKQGFRPADLRELLAFAAAYPDVPSRASVFAFGSFKKYRTVEFDKFGGGSMPLVVDQVVKFQNFYPAVVHGLFGRSVSLIQDDSLPSFDPAGFGCFVAVESGASPGAASPS